MGMSTSTGAGFARKRVLMSKKEYRGEMYAESPVTGETYIVTHWIQHETGLVEALEKRPAVTGDKERFELAVARNEAERNV